MLEVLQHILHQQSHFTVYVTTPTRPASLVRVIQGMKDQDIVLFNVRYKYNRTSRLPLKLYQYYKADFDKLRQDVSKGASEFFTRCVHSHLEDNWSFFKTILTVAVDKHVPSKMSSSRISLPRIIRSIKRQMGKRDRLLKKSKAHGWQTLTSVAWISLPKKQSGEIT